MPNSSTQMTLGVNTCFAIKRWAEPAEWAAVLADLGIEDVQFSIDLLPVGFDLGPLRSYTARMRQALDANGLRLHSWFTGLGAYGSNLLLADDAEDREAARAWYGEMIRLAGESGARGFGGHLGALSVPAAADPVRSRELLDSEFEAMRGLADLAHEVGLDHLQFENLAVVREFGHSIAESHAIEEAMVGTAVPWRLCLDLGHPMALPEESGSTDPVGWLQESWKQTPVIQLQQSPRGADHHGPFTPETEAAGGVRRDDCLAALAEQQYDDECFMFFEIIPSHEQADDTVVRDLKTSIEHWRSALSAQ